jgi:hydroxyethylthiazole kinase-like uncharacterized protein yjeF
MVTDWHMVKDWQKVKEMFNSLSCSEIRRLDADAIQSLGLPSLLLMENAARGVCDAICQPGPWNSITILAGPGNNGGDGFAAARQLAAIGMECHIFLLRGDRRMSVDAEANLQFLKRSGIRVRETTLPELQTHCAALDDRDLIVDSLLGTGIRGLVSSPFAEAIDCMNASSAWVLSVDVPSGLDCDTGLPCGTSVRADQTVTFVALKNGFLSPAAREFTGTITVCPIGIPELWLTTWFSQLPERAS